jgi:hypothetical protein
MTRIRLRTTVTGSFHGIEGGIERGQVVDVDDISAARYVKNGLAELVKETVESAVVEPEGVESALVRRPRGRPRKQPEWDDEHAQGWKDASPQ